jgi:hypothetical protein
MPHASALDQLVLYVATKIDEELRSSAANTALGKEVSDEIAASIATNAELVEPYRHASDRKLNGCLDCRTEREFPEPLRPALRHFFESANDRTYDLVCGWIKEADPLESAAVLMELWRQDDDYEGPYELDCEHGNLSLSSNRREAGERLRAFVTHVVETQIMRRRGMDLFVLWADTLKARA